MAALALCAAAHGCGDPDNRAIVEITAEGVEVPAEVDRVTIRLTASRADAAEQVCKPFVLELSLDPTTADAVDLPFRLGVNPGEQFGGLLFVQLEASKGGTVRYRLERSASLSGGEVFLRFPLDQACLDVGTAPGQMCLEGQSLPSEMPFLTDPTHPWVQQEERCVQ